MMTINILSVGIIDFYCVKARALPVSPLCGPLILFIIHSLNLTVVRLS